ncbi:hypothetical protein GCM10009827_037850 [Dactylosporangium maewongense]|uniref:Uncharacterized protein n=1 Tax=Dactylosporangium maewongense TaxID=634393 RepID=A0ABP4L9D2_9ACTN
MTANTTRTAAIAAVALRILPRLAVARSWISRIRRAYSRESRWRFDTRNPHSSVY